ncbi:hypothetical protein ACF1G0_25435 [Streptomyces sp. NPDC013953]|uniref:hypothetical protein n=1 Tax=Streptomyces sp. NPDC013953 TaxID=3364868 RepID=UPI0036FE2C7E
MRTPGTSRSKADRRSGNPVLGVVLTAAAVLLPVPAATAEDHAALAAKRLGITMQAQQKANWCWAAAGNAAEGARRLPGGTVFREPQIDAWYVHRGTEVLPLDEDAIRAVGADGTTLAAYRHRVRAAYADKLPGSAYAKEGRAGGYGTSAAPPGTAGASGTALGTAPRAATASAAAAPGSPFPAGPAAAAAAAAAAVATALACARARRPHRRRP